MPVEQSHSSSDKSFRSKTQFTGFFKPMVAGAMAGTTVDLLFYPIDTIKTRLQSQNGFVASGGFKGVYKGLGSVAVGSAPGAALFFTTYEYCKRSLVPTVFPSVSSPIVHMISASLGEAACLIRVPTEVIKQRQQTAAYGPGVSSARALGLVIQQDGFKSLYQGFGITVLREVPFSLMQFPLYEKLKSYASGSLALESSDKLPAQISALCGSIAGATAAALTTPLDVIKTRTMLTKKRNDSQIKILKILNRVYLEEGWAAFWKGIIPRTIWMGLGGSVFLGVYEVTIQHIGGPKKITKEP